MNNKNFLSPIQFLQEKSYLEQGIIELLKVHQQLVKRLSEIDYLINQKVGPKGDKPTEKELIALIQPFVYEKLDDKNLSRLLTPLMPHVEDGHTPTREELIELIRPLIPYVEDGKTPEKGVDYMSEEQVKDYVQSLIIKTELQEMEETERMVDKINKLPKHKKLTMKHIDGLEQTISAIQHQTANGYLHGGGVPSLTAGNGVTLTQKSDGGYIVSTSAASSSIIPAIGVINDSNVAFAVASEPSELVLNGVCYLKTGGAITWSWSSGTVTLSSPPGVGGTIYFRK